MRLFLILAFLGISSLYAAEITPAKIKSIYNSLDRQSVAQHLALYDLYPETLTGQQALNHALTLLSGDQATTRLSQIPDFKVVINGIIGLANKQANKDCPCLPENILETIQGLSKDFPNKKLKGYSAWSEQEVLSLPTEEIDLARGLLLSDMGDSEEVKQQIRAYEALLDLMALQMIAQLPLNPKPTDIIRVLNDFIFFEMGFRFPPHSQSVKDIDVYSFLPSVIDSRKGVCLGVSILYLCLSQRLGLPLEIITPPGHIFVRYHQGNTSINIETTARGIELEDEAYLNVDTRHLQKRTLKETIGMAHFNQAAVYWQQNDSPRALLSYEKAQRYIPDDKLLKELMGFNYLIVGETDKGIALLQETRDYLPDFAVSKQTVAEDYLNGHTDVEGIKAIFMFVDDDRESLLKKKQVLLDILKKHPNFRSGLFSLAGTWLQLHRMGEGLEALERLHELDQTDPTVEYYLAELHAQRLNYNKAWEHLLLAEEIVQKRDHNPKALKLLRQKLSHLAPEYLRVD